MFREERLHGAGGCGRHRLGWRCFPSIHRKREEKEEETVGRRRKWDKNDWRALRGINWGPFDGQTDGRLDGRTAGGHGGSRMKKGRRSSSSSGTDKGQTIICWRISNKEGPQLAWET